MTDEPLADASKPEWDRLPLSERRATVLSKQTGMAVERLVGRPLAELRDELSFQIDPELLFFRRICGRVVKKHPVTGILQPVAGATVHVEDTDCSFLGFFPVENPWFWLFPISCRREEIATVTTDECGHFCVYVPRWEIDWILRLRRTRRCYIEIRRPSVIDLLERLRLVPKRPFPPPPEPPYFDITRSQALPAVVDALGPLLSTQLVATPRGNEFGASTAAVESLLSMPVHGTSVPPPLPSDIAERFELRDLDVAGDALADVDPDVATFRIDPRRFVGPFIRCEDVLVAQWQPIVDVPDITFSVTQDVDGDGDEETIYSEGYFDVRWNAGPIPDVTLVASALALASPTCDVPLVECENVPAIRTAGLMPLESPYHDPTTGFALRTNQPRLGGLSSSPRTPPAQTPYCLALQLHGCHHVNNAAFYRLFYAHDGASPVPFTGLEWWAPKLGGGPPFHVTSDSDGWLAVLPENQLVFPHWLLNWETWRYGNGHYVVTLQVGDGAKNPIAPDSAPVALEIDNSGVSANFLAIRWRAKGTIPWTLLPELCPVIRRNHKDVEIQLQWQTSALHFFHAEVFGIGCDDIAIDHGSPSAAADYEHWHTSGVNNAYTATGIFEIPKEREEGAYTFGVNAYSRAYNPAGSDAGPGLDFIVDHAFLAAYPRRSIAIVE